MVITMNNNPWFEVCHIKETYYGDTTEILAVSKYVKKLMNEAQKHAKTELNWYRDDDNLSAKTGNMTKGFSTYTVRPSTITVLE